ncbi:MAG: zinc ribbon domain-containing protein [Deltaproteobacteria bacterium]|nr:MAG: zinc ribbon domain-containing protein [Deltaproteobacteria bacterium]
MPIYEYLCDKCKHRFELMQRIDEEPPKTCPRCRGRVHKVISPAAFVLKGTGWYATDYAGKGKKDTTQEKKLEEKTDSSKST